MSNEPKIIIFDLETLPNLEEALKIWPSLGNFPGRTMRATITSIICAGWKELGSKEVHCINAWDYPEWQHDVNFDYWVCLEIYEALKDADAVITHNGRRFDWKHLQTRLLVNGLPPLPKIPHIDTYQVVRSNLLAYSNALGSLGEWMLEDTKLKHEGWGLWVKTWYREQKSMDIMDKYCKKDVILLEKVFNILRPFITNLPNRNKWRSNSKIVNDEFVCPTCGSPDLKNWGWYHTKTNSYQRLRCGNCGATSRTDAKEKNPRTY